ncbi:MAG: radical SAM protein [Candidatus Rhabdochlamydia sp.]
MNRTLFVILKTAERCNLKCKYCYFFYGGDESFKKHPPFISIKTIHLLNKFLIKGIEDLQLSRIEVIFHGGEPTLQSIKNFEEICSLIQKDLLGLVKITFKIQTNATLITDEWIEIFSKYNIGVGVSLDGPQEYNDINRIDHRNKGSYAAARLGIERLQKAVANKKIAPIGALCVIHPERSAKLIYRHFIDDLAIYKLDFLLPEFTKDNFPIGNVSLYGKYLCELFEEWTEDNNVNIHVRIIDSIIKVLMGLRPSLISIGKEKDDLYAITISSNGEISPDDTLRIIEKGSLMQVANIENLSMNDFFNLPMMQSIKSCAKSLPEGCANCCWQEICCGGHYIHRYSSKNGFNNPSVMCEALKMIYAKASAFLLKSGYPASSLKNILNIK